MKQNFIFGFRARGGEYHEHMGIAQLYETECSQETHARSLVLPSHYLLRESAVE